MRPPFSCHLDFPNLLPCASFLFYDILFFTKVFSSAWEFSINCGNKSVEAVVEVQTKEWEYTAAIQLGNFMLIFCKPGELLQTKTGGLSFPFYFAERSSSIQSSYLHRSYGMMSAFTKTDLVHCHFWFWRAFSMLLYLVQPAMLNLWASLSITRSMYSTIT